MRQSTCNTSLVLRKGAWTVQEDMLLKSCIQKHGEGKWHLVPLRAGLNRCRKSCRLRWLNYLRPNIKKGAFGEDEVDLMLRIHRLIGNRWSLIAGRMPGRTANDVKNYWNTHVRSRPKQQKEEPKDVEPSQHTMATIFKPQPRTISKTFNFCQHITTNDTGNLIASSSNDGINNSSNTFTTLVSSPTVSNDKMNGNLITSSPNDGINNLTNTFTMLVSSPIVSNDKINSYLETRNLITSSSNDGIKNLSNAFTKLVSSPRVSNDKMNTYLDDLFDGEENEIDNNLWVGEGLDGLNSMLDLPVDDVVMWDLLQSNQL
ncbi:hypothetical protein R6Q57_030000 [Mikania cordata]